MSIRFIVGNSGSGKTEYMYSLLVQEAERHPRKNYLVIVPEQFTLQTQRKLVELSTHNVIMNVDVLSFKRLAYRVFDDLGIQTVQILEETGKNLVLRRIAQEQQENLHVLGSNMSRMGYISEVKSLISELMQYNISARRLDEHVENMSGNQALSEKLKDIAVMYQAFEDFMEGSFITAEEVLTVLERLAAQSELLRDSVIAFDEFTGFTPIQNQLLAEIMRHADRLLFALTIDAREDLYHSRGSYELFDMPKQTMRILMDIAAHNRIPVEEPIILGKPDKCRFVKSEDLFFLEQNLFRSAWQRRKGAVRDVRLASYRNPKEETVYVAREIARLVQQEGYRYRDIAVVTGAVANYRSYVPEIFARYEIPCFVDTTTEIMFHPFIEFIRAVLEVVDQDYSYEAVLRLLRCGFFPLEDSEIDRLENYLLASGIRGQKRWAKKWNRVTSQTDSELLDKLNVVRKMVYTTLRPLTDAFSGKGMTVEEEIRALYGVIVSLKVEEQLWQRADEYLARDEQVHYEEYRQIYPVVMNLLDKYVAILGTRQMQIREFVEILDAGLDAVAVASVPPGYDCVTIGDIERTRLNHIRILFFIGVNDGVIPKGEGRGGILSEYERELLAASDLPLAPGAREQTFIQRYYLYLNMTKPSERLYVSYVRIDAEGKALRPSYLIHVLRRLFPDLAIDIPGAWENSPDYATLAAAKDYLVHNIDPSNDEWCSLARFFLEGEEPEREFLEKLLDAFYARYDPDKISRIVAEALYGRELIGSVTRLERFAACAYAHFLHYGLQLRERELSGLASVDMGNIYHTALERYSHLLAESGEDWFSVTDEHRSEMAEKAIDQTLAEYPSLAGEVTGAQAHMADRMRHIFGQTVWALTRQVRKGTFVPSQFEVSFHEPDAREALQFDLGDHQSLTLTGRMDRVDVCENEDGYHIKVIDYKSGAAKFDLVKIYQGTQLQLMVYMNAATAMAKKNTKKTVIPGGVLYYHIDDPVIEAEETMTEEQAREAILMQLRPDGLVNSEESIYRLMDEDFSGKSDAIPVTLKKSGEISERGSHVADSGEFAVIGAYVSERIRRTAAEILDGVVAVNPVEEGQMTSCTYCPYRAVCGMDLRIDGYAYRHPQKVGRDEVLERMRTDLARRPHEFWE